jgi:hypothetical protein
MLARDPKGTPRRKRSRVVVRSEVAAAGGVGTRQAERFKRTQPYRGAIRAAYKTQPVKQRVAYVRQGAMTPERQAIVHTHTAEVSRNKTLAAGRARSTGFPEQDKRRVAKFQRNDALSKETQERVYSNALALARRQRKYLPGTNPSLNAMSAYGSIGAAKHAVESGEIKLRRGGLGDPGVKPPDTVAKERAMTKVAVDAAKAGASQEEIGKALTGMEKRHKSPALSVLEQFNRPISAVAGGVKGGPVGAVKGAVSNKESFTKILKDAGYSKGAYLGAGLVLDIALDPTTYVTFGTGRPALVAARQAAKVAAKDAVEKGLERAAVERAAHAAAERTFASHGAKGVGIKVGVRGTPVRVASTAKQVVKGKGLREAAEHSAREVSTSGRATSRLIGTPGAKVTGAVSKRLPQKLRADLDQIGQGFIHSYRPRAFSPVEWDRMRSHARSYRAGMSRAERAGEARLQAYRAALHDVPAERHRAIIDAVEVRDIERLPKEEQPIAAAMLRDAESMAKAETKAGVRAPDQVIRPRRAETFPSPDIKGSRKELQKTRRAAAAAEREVRKAEAELARSGGRAEVLSRNVGGVRSEQAARRALRTGEVPSGGGVGIREAQGRLAAAEAKRADALDTLRAHTESHAENVALAKEARAARRRADRLDTEATGYVARYVRGDLEPDQALRVYRGEPGGRKVTGTSLRRRQERMPLSEQPEANRERLIQDIPTIMGERTAEGERLRTLSRFNAQMAGHGKPVTDANEIDVAVDSTTGLPDPVDMQRFYVVGDRGDMTPLWRTVDRSDQLLDRIHGLVESGKEVIEVPRESMEAMWGLAKRGRVTGQQNLPTKNIPTLLWDEGTRKWKWLVTQPNPGYHARNLLGDAWNARLGGATLRDVGAALRTIKGVRRHLDGLSKDMLRGVADDVSPERLKAMGKTERFGSNGQLSDAEVLLLAEQHGAVRSGQIANELRNLRRGTSVQERGRVARHLQGFSEAREDLMRLATFRRALKRGDTPEAAAAYANKHHFDYSDLTDFEVRALRRMMPFYTFMARNTPLQLASLIESPGRFATLEKVRDASADAAGLPEDWAATMPEYVQASVPFAMPRGLPGSTSTGLPMLASPMLPVTDLNNTTPHQIGARIAQSVSPFFKLPVELFAKYDFFYRDKIRKDLVPAPAWSADPDQQRLLRNAVGILPGVGKPTFGYITDRRSGKKVPAWPWWMDKLARQSPISGLVTGLATPGRERRPGDRLVSLTNWATGVRRQAIDPAEARTTQLFDDLQRVEEEIAMAKQRRDKAPGSPYGGKLKALSKERSAIQAQLSAATSDFASPYFDQPKAKKKTPKFGASGGFGTGSFGKPSRRGKGKVAQFGSGSWGG